MLDDDQDDELDDEYEPAPPEPDYDLPKLLADLNAPWRQRAACRGKPTWQWYPSRGEVLTGLARSCCASCPVREECLSDAISRNELGFWGGESERGRRRIRQHRTVRAQRAARGLT